MIMKISVLGTGNMGKALVKQVAAYVEGQVLWGSRNSAEAAGLAKNFQLDQIVTVSYVEALQADIIIPAFPVSALMDWAQANKEQLKHKIVVDISNPFNDDFSGFTTAWGESSSERLQSLLPESKVIGAFKNTFFKVFENPVFQDQKSDVLVTGDDEEAVLRFIERFKPLPFRFLHAGKLANNRTIERLTLLELELAVRYGTYPYISLQLFGIKEAVLAN
ncbi:NAD(P)-binding domain-containing protein [Paenibacillus sp. WST5]|uniref:NAD(P)-binding domain-containing protein n=2 Tax=Paenibacillus sedimenti TaxID=2770274 RepID=A0A926KT99_9BACL|nr:NAD(P)-binding domain-containing protein [Paenibacillus sedimenti]